MKKKVLSLLLAVVMLVAMAVPALAVEEEPPILIMAPAFVVEGDYTGKTVILHTNDVHGAVGGYAKVAALKADFEAAGAEVLLLDAGDFIQGTTSVSVSEGATAVELMNLVGYDVVTLGNHEFDYGYANLTTILENAEFNVTSNVSYNGEAAFHKFELYELACGLNLGIMGLTTPETATKAHPAKIQGVTFAAGEDLYAYAQETVDVLSVNADIVLVLSHLGVDDESITNRSYDLYEKVTGIDFIIDGHSHTVMTEGVNGEPIQSTGTALANVGVIVIGEEGIEENKLINLADYMKEDETVKAAAEGIVAEIEEIYGAVFATTEILLDGNRSPGVRTQNTNLGDLITDALLWQATKDGGLAVDDAHVVAITNGGGIRATIQAGDVTMNDINTVLPFGNTVALVYVTGEELLEVLEASTFCTPEAVGAFPQTAGIKYTLNTGVEYDANPETYPGSTYYGPASINRVAIESINGQPFDKAATYAIVTNDFLAAGGDTYYAFTVAENVMDTGVPMDVAVMAYVEEVLDGKITAEKYGTPRTDLTIVNEPKPESVTYTVVAGDSLWKIAKTCLGSGFKWESIYEANKAVIKNPNVIFVGQELLIPTAK